MRRIKRRVVGLTLIELLITLFIASLLASMTLPGLRDLLDRFKLQRACSEFRSALALTRSEAIRRGVRVDLVPAAAGDWRNGWLVLIDTNNNQRADVGEAVLHQGGVPPEGLHIVSSLRDPKPYLAFDPSGRPRSAASSAVPQRPMARPMVVAQVSLSPPGTSASRPTSQKGAVVRKRAARPLGMSVSL